MYLNKYIYIMSYQLLKISRAFHRSYSSGSQSGTRRQLTIRVSPCTVASKFSVVTCLAHEQLFLTLGLSYRPFLIMHAR